jgi:predicted DNA-binding protein
MPTISLKIPVALDRRLRRIAEVRQTTRSAVIRAAIEHLAAESAERTGSCLALASDLIGCVEGPADLASNKQHLQGFGQ